MKQLIFFAFCLLTVSCTNTCVKQPETEATSSRALNKEVEVFALDGLTNDNFGGAVATNGTFTAVGSIGSRWKVPNTTNPSVFKNKAGGVYIYDNSNTFVKKLVGNDVQILDYTGSALCFDGNKLLVGVYGDNEFNSDGTVRTDRGSAYLFDGDNSWNQMLKLEPADSASAYAYFGSSVSLENNIAIVGANKATINGKSAQGSAYVFNATTGNQLAKLTASDGAANHYFGTSVDQEGGQIFIGAMGRINNKGAIYVYDATTFTQTQIITANIPTVGAWFGASISVEGDWMAVGSPSIDSYKGAVYMFQKNGNTWNFVKKLTADDALVNDRLGTSVCLKKDIVTTGAPQVNNLTGTGVVYTFLQNKKGHNNWGQTSKTVPSNGVVGDQFGNSVSVFKNTTIVGARARNSQKGAAYIYK